MWNIPLATLNHLRRVVTVVELAMVVEVAKVGLLLREGVEIANGGL